jgi:hypothetical protein
LSPVVTATKGSLWVNLLSGIWRTFQRTSRGLAAPQEAVTALRRAERVLVALTAPRAQKAVLAPLRRRLTTIADGRMFHKRLVI